MKNLFVIGNPIAHSKSPQMQNAAIKAIGLEKDFFYDKRLVTDLSEIFEDFRKGNIFGMNITIPHKIEATKYVDELTKEATFIGAINTVFISDGKLVGHNTDGIGCMRALHEKNVVTKDKVILIIGAGGAARAISMTLGLHAPKKIIILNEFLDAAEKLCQDVHKNTAVEVISGTLENIATVLPAADIIIHCTPIGMKGEPPLINVKELRKDQVVMDIVYPTTDLLKEAKEIGCVTVDGLAMLVHQGAEALKIWTGKEVPVDVMRAAL